MDRSLYITLMSYTITLLFLYLLFTILAPFMAVLVWAGAIGIITYPLYTIVLERCRGREIRAAIIMTAVVILSVVVPLVGLLFSLSREAATAYHYLESVSTGTTPMALDEILKHPLLAPWMERISPLIGTFNLDLEAMLLPAIKKGLAAMLNYSTDIVKNFFGFLFKLVLMLITLFFIYKDGADFLRRFWQAIAIGERLRTTIASTVTRVLGAVMYGVILTCLVQGTLGGLGFWVAGLPSPFLFGTLMAICAPIPFVGTALVWLPGAVYLLAQGHLLAGVALIIWGVLVVSGIDNIIRPLFISGKAKLPILVIVFGVLGGFLAFGLSGLVVGPVVLAIVLVFFEAYRESAAEPDKINA